MTPGSQRVAEFRAIVRLMPDGSRRLSLRIDRAHVTVLRTDRKVVGPVMEAIHDAMHDVGKGLSCAIVEGAVIAEEAMEKAKAKAARA